MHYERYEFVSESPDLKEFRFYSEGPNGRIEMVIEFQQIYSIIYNLAFGNISREGSIDDVIKTMNNDRDKILATVAAAVFEFTLRFPLRIVIFKGSTPARNRLYRMAIGKNIAELNDTFSIKGVVNYETEEHVEPFTRNVCYEEFVIERK